MMIGKLLLCIMFFRWLTVASEDSGNDNSCPGQVLQCPNTTIEGKVDETVTLKEKPCSDTELQCPNTTIEGKVNETVILPCSAKDKANISLEQVEWLFEDPTTGDYHTILMYHLGKEFKNQSKDFDNRTSLFKKELAFGNCSLSLKVTTFDNGTYYCSVQGHVCCPVTLKVLPREDPSQMQGNNGLALKTGLGVCIPAAFVIFIIGLGCCYREQLKNYMSGPNSNSPQTHPEVSYHPPQPPLKMKKINKRPKPKKKNRS